MPWNGKPNPDADYQLRDHDGIMPLYQRCVHLGCRVPFCGSSKWFECPCHGSKYNFAGEYQLGPAPRGMDRFKLTVENGNVLVDTSVVVLGPPRGTDTIDEPPQGPFCVAPGRKRSLTTMLALSDSAGVVLLVLGGLFVVVAVAALVLRGRVTASRPPISPPR